MTRTTLPLTLALSIFALAYPAHGGTPPDRCAKLDEDGYPMFCDPIGEHIAPGWDDPVCCDGAACEPLGTLGCEAGTQLFSCDHAELDALGNVTCLFLVPHYCDENPCGPTSNIDDPQLPQAQELCCYEEGCYAPDGDLCAGVLYWCDQGSTNEDGTVTCDDEDAP